MSETPQDHISTKRVLYTLPGMENVATRREEYKQGDGGPLTVDFYYPPAVSAEARTPAVLFVTGYADAGAQRMLGCKFRDMGAFVSWAQLVAVSGMIAITYENAQPYDVDDVLDYVRAHAAEFGVDENRIGLWACSGYAPNALSLLMERGGDVKSTPPLTRRAPGTPACAALLYPYTLDADAATGVADMAAKVKFVTVGAEKSVRDLPCDVPLFVVRAGRDAMPGLNEALDRFVRDAITAQIPVTLFNHPTGPHAFDLFDDSDTTRDAIQRTLAFLQTALGDTPRNPSLVPAV